MGRALCLSAAVLVVAGCSSSGVKAPTIGAARTFALTGFTPHRIAHPGTTKLSFTIRQPSGAPLTSYRHGSGPHTGVHLIVVRHDLGAIIHRHPPIGADGRITQAIDFPTPGPYRVLVDAYPAVKGAPRNFQLHEDIRVGGAYHPQPLPPYSAKQTVDGYHVTLAAPRSLHAIEPAHLTATVSDPAGPPAPLHALVRSPRPRRLLPAGLARLLPHPRLRAVDARLHQRARRDPRDRNVVEAREAPGRRAAAGRRDLAALPPVPGRRPDPHRAVYAQGHMRRLLWLPVAALLVLVARWLCYALAAPSPLAKPLQASAGGPRLVVVTLVSLGLAAGVSVFAVWLAALGVRERAAPDARAGRAEHPRCAGSSFASSVLYATSSLAFALFESYLHWRAGIGFHGLSCLVGPVHQNAIPILGALALAAAALAEAGAHVLAWMRAVVRELLRQRLAAQPLSAAPAFRDRALPRPTPLRARPRGPPLFA